MKILQLTVMYETVLGTIQTTSKTSHITYNSLCTDL